MITVFIPMSCTPMRQKPGRERFKLPSFNVPSLWLARRGLGCGGYKAELIRGAQEDILAGTALIQVLEVTP
jgi:hypothetical protein